MPIRPEPLPGLTALIRIKLFWLVRAFDITWTASVRVWVERPKNPPVRAYLAPGERKIMVTAAFGLSRGAQHKRRECPTRSPIAHMETPVSAERRAQAKLSVWLHTGNDRCRSDACRLIKQAAAAVALRCIA